jgi:hypothetical protein
MPITFGSVGDIISVSLLVKDVLVALSESRGSSVEYQEIIRELYILDRALLEIEQLSRQYASTLELTALCQTAAKAVSECRNSVKTFLDRTAKYHRSLSDRSKANALSKATRTVQFAVVERNELSRFRAEISAHSLSLNMLLTTASVYVSHQRVGRSALRNVNNLIGKLLSFLEIVPPSLREILLWPRSRLITPWRRYKTV